MTDTITIPYPILSRNVVDRMHRFARLRLIEKYGTAIKGVMAQANVSRADGERYAITLTTYRIRPIADEDNVYGSTKQMLDAMSRTGFIPDDRRECIGRPEVRQERCKRKNEERTVITRKRVE